MNRPASAEVNFGTTPYDYSNVVPVSSTAIPFLRYFIRDGSLRDGFGAVAFNSADVLDADGNEDVELWQCMVSPLRRVVHESELAASAPVAPVDACEARRGS